MVYGYHSHQCIMAGFRKAGVFPFDPEALAISATADNEPNRKKPDGVTEAVGGNPHSPMTGASNQWSLTTLIRMATLQRKIKLMRRP